MTIFNMLIMLTVTGESLFMVYKWNNSAPARSYIVSAVLILVNISVSGTVNQWGSIPFFDRYGKYIAASVVILTVLHLIQALLKDSHRVSKYVSSSSVYEALDGLTLGVCFADSDGRIVLCNNRMRIIAKQLTGEHPQLMENILSAISSPPETVISLPENSLEFQDGKIYQFRLSQITVEGEPCRQQLMAQEVTELHNMYRQLDRENEKLKQTNRRLNEMYNRMTDDIREKESLELKVYIHDTMGRSLLTIRNIINNDAETDMKLQSLKRVVSVLSDNRPALRGTMYEVKEAAAKMGVKVNVKGYIPAGAYFSELIAAAARECITNCIRHAKGNEVTVEITDMGRLYRIVITNNGNKPEHEISEGSGLSSLRRRVVAEGGEMHVFHEPEFSLTLIFPRKGKPQND